MNRRRLAAIAFMPLLGSSAFAYLLQVYTPGDGSAPFLLRRTDNTGIQIFINNQMVAGAASSLTNRTVITAKTDPAVALQSALASWNAVATANVVFLPLQTTDKGRDSTDFRNVVMIGSTDADLSALGGSSGALGVTIGAYVVADGTLSGGQAVKRGQLFDADILINPGYTFSVDNSTGAVDLQAVLLHELGHLLGSNHSGLLGTTMYPFESFTARYLGPDEKAFATFLYPAKANSLGTLSGKVTLSDGATPVKLSLLTFIDRSAGTMLGGLTGSDGTYSIQLPPGNYVVYAEPFNTLINPANFYVPSSFTGVLDGNLSTNGFLPTLLTGAGSAPTTIAVQAGAAVTAPVLKVNSGTSAIGIPFVALGAAGGSGGIGSLLSFSGPITLTSGQSVDLALAGGGVDAGTVVQIYGPQGVVITPGSVRVDPKVNVGGQPLLRATVTIPPQFNISLASLFLTRGSGVTSFSGGLVILPPTPTVSNVQDAESGRTTIVPGEWVAIYGANLSASSFRIWGGADFVNGNLLPKNLDGATVTFDGIPAAVYFTIPGQMNVQAPGNISGNVPVVVANNGSIAASFTATVVPSSPSFFIYGAGSKTYTAAVHATAPPGCANPCIVGDPAVTPGTAKAKAGETIIFYVNGLGSSPAGVIVSAPVNYTSPVTVTVAGQTANVSFAGLVAAGEFQLNVTLPSNLAAGDQVIAVSTQGQTSPSGVTIPIG